MKEAISLPGVLFLEKLQQHGSRLAKHFLPAINKSVRQYLTELIPYNVSPPNVYFQTFINALHQLLELRNEQDADLICQNLTDRPVIQQADHSNLLFDAETFMNNFLFHIAHRENNIPTMTSWQCSTVSCITRLSPLTGPVFLHTRNNLYKVFPFSKRKLTRSTFCALPGPLQMVFENLLPEGNEKEDHFFKEFRNGIFPDPSSAFRICNDKIWNSLRIPLKTRRIGIDESLSSQIVSRHLSDNYSPVTRLIFDPPVRNTFLQIKRALIASGKYFTANNPAPDLLWFRKGDRLFPIVLKENDNPENFYVDTGSRTFAVSYDRKSLIQALESGNLYPDRFLIYLVRCLLPRIVAAGGTSQQEYLPMYKHLLESIALESDLLDRTELKALCSFNASVLGGYPLVEPNEQYRKFLAFLGPGSDFSPFENSFIDMPLGEAIGKFQCAHYLEKEVITKPAIKR